MFIVLATPWARYRLAALVIKNDFSIQVLDSTTGDPVSDAVVATDSLVISTDGSGRAVLRGLSPGDRLITVSKQNYEDEQVATLVPIFNQKITPRVTLHTTGSLIKVGVTNLVTKHPLGNVDIKAGSARAHTDSNGYALLAVPAGSTFQPGELSLPGYNSKAVNFAVKAGVVWDNGIALTPSGKAYFLSKPKGIINVMSADLDGTNQQVLLAGSGHEDSNTTILPSPNNQFLALMSRRTADPHAQIYIIDTTKSKATEIAFGAATFKLHGWAGSRLAYSATFDGIKTWKAGKHKLMTYDATIKKSSTINQTLAAGNSERSTHQTYGSVLVGTDTVLLGLNWVGVGDNAAALMSGKDNVLIAIPIGGADSQTVANYDAAKYSIAYSQYAPNSIYLRRISIAGAADQFFSYSIGDSQPEQVQITLKQFNQPSPRYFVSPNQSQAMWTQTTSGNNTILVGDKNGQTPSILLDDTRFNAYGWATDQFALLAKAGGLYVMGAGTAPLKITDYIKGQ